LNTVPVLTTDWFLLKWDAKLTGITVSKIKDLLKVDAGSPWQWDYYEEISLFIIWRNTATTGVATEFDFEFKLDPTTYTNYPLFTDDYGFKYSQFMRS
jgi:hypothetical protein